MKLRYSLAQCSFPQKTVINPSSNRLNHAPGSLMLKDFSNVVFPALLALHSNIAKFSGSFSGCHRRHGFFWDRDTDFRDGAPRDIEWSFSFRSDNIQQSVDVCQRKSHDCGATVHDPLVIRFLQDLKPCIPDFSGQSRSFLCCERNRPP